MLTGIEIGLRAGFLALLPYPFLAVIYVRWLRPQLAPPARRLTYFLVACHWFLLLFHGMTAGQTFQHARFFWHFNGEFNAPSGFASLQFVLVASQALALAWALRSQVEWRYWLGVSGLFLMMAVDEHALLHEWGDAVEGIYLLFGILLTAATWIWLARKGGPAYAPLCRWIIIGLAISTIGAVGMDRVAPFCPAVDEACLPFYLTEEVLELSGILVVAVTLQGVAFRALPKTRWPVFGRQSFALLALLAWVVYGVGRLAFPTSERAFLPYRLPILRLHDASVTNFRAGDDASVSVSMVATQTLPASLGYTLQLYDPLTGEVWAAFDRWSELAADQWPVGEPVSQTFSLSIPGEIPTNRNLWLLLYLWWHDGIGYWNLPFYAGGYWQITEQAALLDEFVVLAPAPAQEGQADVFAPGFTLQARDLPERARAGDTLTITFHWQAKTAGQEDWQQFLHFTHEESGALWNHDQPPLGERLPTRNWYPNLSDTERWQFTLPDDLAPGRYQVHTGLYRLSDGQRAPTWSATGEPWPEAKVLLGSIEISAP